MPVVEKRLFILVTDCFSKERQCGGGAILTDSRGNFCNEKVPVDGIGYMDSFCAEATAILGGILLVELL